MCGINGIISSKSVNNIYQRISKMNDSIKHRGPDADNCVVLKDGIAFGHRRLAIIDTDKRSEQPMYYNSRQWIIVYNGEIYNYQELRRHLSCTFKTNSDTEVILAYIEEFGIHKFLEKANGMFAFGLFNLSNNKLYLVRDRFGIKPLFYYIDGRSIIFSSEIKGILSSGLIEAKFNEAAIDDYLGYRYVREPNTFFENIYSLDAGSYLEFDFERPFRIEKYWALPNSFNMSDKYNAQLIKGEFEVKLVDSIKRRLIADVPLGTYLSGGVDSSLITAIVAQNIQAELNTYTIGFDNLNEFYFSNLVAKQYNTSHHTIAMSYDDYFEQMEQIIYYKDAPLGVPNEVPLAVMSKELKKDITVVLSGEGADELLGGYGKIYRTPFDFKNNAGKNFYAYFIDKYEYVPRAVRDKYLTTSLIYRDLHDKKIKKDFNLHVNEENVFRFFYNYHIKGLLHRMDTTTMLAGVEARVPFLDHVLVEYAFRSVPYDLKLKWNSEDDMKVAKSLTSNYYSEILDTPKYLLKEIAYDYLPEEVIERPKMGFPVPLNTWKKELENQAYNILSTSTWLKANSIQDLLLSCQENERNGQLLWMFINVELFRKKYFTKSWKY